MGYLFIGTILTLGLSGIVAQIILLRELLVSFYGNELSWGIILANWLISEAIGVFLIGRYIDRTRFKLDLFIFLKVIFCISLPISIYLSRTFKTGLGIPFGEGLGLVQIFSFSFLIILPVSFAHGALFSIGCSLFKSIGKVYALETIGTVIGGIITTYIFLPYLDSLKICFLVLILNLFISILWFKNIQIILIRMTILFLAGFSLIFGLFLNRIHLFSLGQQFAIGKVLAYRNSVYGNLVVTQKEAQYTFFYNGTPIVTTPCPDITFVEEFGNLPLLFHPHPSRILIISAATGGLLNEIFKHPVIKVDYAELDPLIIKMLKEYSTALTEAELKESRLRIINTDGRYFASHTQDKYDVILIGLSKPQDLSTNRLFTREFFLLLKQRLNKDGILSLWLPGSLTYLSQDLKDINVCILNSLKNVYKYIRIIPGDYNILLACPETDLFKTDSFLIKERLKERNISTKILIPDYIDYRLDLRWLDWFKDSIKGATKKINQDLKPFLVFKMLGFYSRQFSPWVGHFLDYFQGLDFIKIMIFILLFTFLFYLLFKIKRLERLSVVYSIATTGFFGMLANLILIFSFQVFYGYVYQKIGILISFFMTGIALGSIIINHYLERIKQPLRLFIYLESIITIFSYLLALVIIKGKPHFLTLFFISGFLLGSEFPLAGKIYLEKDNKTGHTSGLLYCADLLGSCLAGIGSAILFLPILGVFTTCGVIVLFKISSLILLFVFKRAIALK
ncbi:MAG: hypothetical protein NC912_06575 [Candidatus Omnitrophica bacterium]|nr:hypothetical protein [Candidatus Omnitrophota bacterium]